MPPLRELEPGRRQIDRYGAGGFRILGEARKGSLIMLPSATLAWPVTEVGALVPDDVAPLIAARDEFQFVLIGTGASHKLLPKPVREALAAAGVRFDAMDTGAACRTYNVLVAEERQVAAALIAVD